MVSCAIGWGHHLNPLQWTLYDWLLDVLVERCVWWATGNCPATSLVTHFGEVTLLKGSLKEQAVATQIQVWNGIPSVWLFAVTQRLYLLYLLRGSPHALTLRMSLSCPYIRRVFTGNMNNSFLKLGIILSGWPDGCSIQSSLEITRAQ